MTDLTCKVSKTIQAPIDRVFDAWLDPALLTQFILPMPGMPQPATKTDPKEGGEFEIVMQVGEDKIPHTGRYIEISKPNKLVFTWESPFSVDDSTVTLTFNASGENETQVDLLHVKFLDEESRDNHTGGWSNILDQLAVITA